MGRDELAAALRQKGAAEADALWQQARAEVGAYRQERSLELSRQSRQCDLDAESSCRQTCQHVDWRVDGILRRMRLQAMLQLEGRLRNLAEAELARLEPAQRDALLKTAGAEAPAGSWQVVRVHPDDQGLAGRLFPDAEVETDPRISGGLYLSTKEGEVRIDNTLETRLASSWPELSGRMLAELEESADGQAAAPDAS